MTTSSTAPRPSPSIPDGGLFAPYAEIKINASAHAIYSAIVDTSTWPKWSTFVPSVDLAHKSEGDKDSPILRMDTAMTLHVKMTSSFETISKEIVSRLEEPPKEGAAPGSIYRLCWIFSNNPLVPRFMLHTERVNEIEVCDDGTCIYRTWDTFGGPYARLVKWKFEQTLKERFEDWARELKAYVEGERDR